MIRGSPLSRLGRRNTIYLPLALIVIFVPFVLSEPDQIKAVAPSCVTDSAGSTSCNVGVNAVPTFASLDGGYQWLSEEVTTTTVSGTQIMETVPVFTATETNYLDVISFSVTYNGAATTSVETQYISWITATPTNSAAADSAVVAGVIIAPALVDSVQSVADNAAGKSVSQVADDIRSALGSKALLTPGDLQGLANYVVAVVAAAGTAKVIIDPYLAGPAVPLSITVTGSSVSSSSSSASGGAGGKATETILTSVGPTVTAIMKPPYSDWQAILAASLAGTQQPINESEPQCSEGTDGTDPSTANKLASVFCTGSNLDFSKDESKSLGGADLNPPVDLKGVSIQFDYTHDTGTCSLNCTASYSTMITSCQYDSHDISGSANMTDDCGTYAMTVVSSSATPTSTAPSGPRPTYTQVCTPHNAPYVAFLRTTGVDAITRSWAWGGGALSIPTSQGFSLRVQETAVNQIFRGNITWSPNQNGCNPMNSDYKVSQSDWTMLYTSAMDDCDTNTVTAKYGAMPLTWNSPNGCIDVYFWAVHT